MTSNRKNLLFLIGAPIVILTISALVILLVARPRARESTKRWEEQLRRNTECASRAASAPC